VCDFVEGARSDDGVHTTNGKVILCVPFGPGSSRLALGAARSPPTNYSHDILASPPIRVTIPDVVRRGELRPVALGPASRLRRRYADAPAGALRAFGGGRSPTALPARLEVRAPGSLLFTWAQGATHRRARLIQSESLAGSVVTG
jgi:hypothetical protein